jgi:membrane-associated phospholipid phosphatase
MKLKYRGHGILFLILILLSNGVFAQIDTVRFNKYYFKKYWTDTKAIVVSPAKWDSKDWTKLGVFVVAETGLSFTDQSVKDYFQNSRTVGLDRVSKNFLEPFGGNYSLLVMSGFMVHGLISKNQRSVSTSLLCLESFALASLFTRIPKILVGRERPNNLEGYGPFTIKGPFHGNSFPSGHTTAVFAVASVVATQYRETKWVPVTAYSMATLVGLSRIYDNKHWLTDVVAGATIGTLVGNLVSHRGTNSKLTVVPFRNGYFQGVRLAYIL